MIIKRPAISCRPFFYAQIYEMWLISSLYSLIFFPLFVIGTPTLHILSENNSASDIDTPSVSFAVILDKGYYIRYHIVRLLPGGPLPGGPLPSADSIATEAIYQQSSLLSFNAPSTMSSRILTNIENIYSLYSDIFLIPRSGTLA